jgi:hypothetical protein
MFNDLILGRLLVVVLAMPALICSVGQNVCPTSAAVKSEPDIEMQTPISRPQAFEMTNEKFMPLGYASEKDRMAPGMGKWRWIWTQYSESRHGRRLSRVLGVEVAYQVSIQYTSSARTTACRRY